MKKIVNEGQRTSTFVYFIRFYLKTIGFEKIFCKRILRSKKKTRKRIRRFKNENYKLPKHVIRANIEQVKINNKDVYCMSKDSDYEYVILYLHGGGYVSQPLVFHWTFCDKLVQSVNAKIVMPIYPMIPNHTFEECYDLLEKVYSKILEKEKNKKIIIMGDSAGGGLSLGFCEYLNEIKLRQPDKLILFSPWLDVTMSHKKVKEYDKKEILLSIDGLIEIGKTWAGKTSTEDYRISPIKGSLENINNVYIYVGTREIFYPDVLDLYERLEKQGSKVELDIGNALGHDFLLYPIKEAEFAFSSICTDITEDN